MTDDYHGQSKGGIFSALGLSFAASPAPPRTVPGSVRQVIRGAAYPPLQGPLRPAEAAEIAAAR